MYDLLISNIFGASVSAISPNGLTVQELFPERLFVVFHYVESGFSPLRIVLLIE